MSPYLALLALITLLSHFPNITFQGKYAEAELLYEKAIKIWEKVHGHDHPKVAAGLNNRAELLRVQVRAIRCFLKFSSGSMWMLPCSSGGVAGEAGEGHTNFLGLFFVVEGA